MPLEQKIKYFRCPCGVRHSAPHGWPMTLQCGCGRTYFLSLYLGDWYPIRTCASCGEKFGSPVRTNTVKYCCSTCKDEKRNQAEYPMNYQPWNDDRFEDNVTELADAQRSWAGEDK